MENKMKATTYTHYGSPEVLHMQELAKPTPKDNEVLIKLHAASINDWDWALLRGVPFVNRLFYGLFKPKLPVLGSDIAGQVEAVGKKVNQFKPGDKVFGDLCGLHWGGFAEYVCAPENRLMIKPDSMTFEEAAAIPQGAVIALQGFRRGKIKQGQQVLINGAGGGSGSFAIQLAKSFGAEVTAVDSARKQDMMQSIGADHIIDYKKEDFTKGEKRYDLILDLMGYHSLFDYKRVLKSDGRYVMVGGSSSLVFQVMLLGPLMSLFDNQKIGILMHVPNKDLAEVVTLFEAGKFKPVIDKSYPLSKTADAFRYFGEGRKRGKVIVTI